MITGLDYTILVLYFVGLIGLSVFLGRRFVDLRDFYLGSRRIPPWAVSASIMATQAGVISMISAPAFGLRKRTMQKRICLAQICMV
jgi:SSS family solute:Na+ symporter